MARRGIGSFVADQPCDEGAEKTASVSDGNGIADHSEVQEREEHFSGEGFDEAFEGDECERAESHSEQEFVTAMGHQIESGYGHESMRDG